MTTRKLRIRHAGGSTTLTIASNATVGDAANEVSSSIGVPVMEQVWKAGGFPPKLLGNLTPNDALDSSLDLIHVSKGSPASIVASTTGSPTTGSQTATEEPPMMVNPDGYAIRRVMDADNSCLFRSISYSYYKKSRNHSNSLRLLVSETIRKDPITYNQAFLGRDDYAKWIAQDSSWGGQIDLLVLSTQLKVEIAAFDVVRNRHDVYGSFPSRIMVLYDGIHYDALAYCLDPCLPEAEDQTIFNSNDVLVMERAQQLCQEQHQAKAFTDTSRFTLRCLVCQEGLEGQEGATKHAKQTSHTNFAKY